MSRKQLKRLRHNKTIIKYAKAVKKTLDNDHDNKMWEIMARNATK